MRNKKISGCVLVHNNEKTVKKCIFSIKTLIDELIIIDDNSTDDTIRIIKQIYPSVKIFKRSLNGDFSAQRNFAISKVNFDWILFVDSDEKISVKLNTEIINLLN